jgi:hypothetical protein
MRLLRNDGAALATLYTWDAKSFLARNEVVDSPTA